MVDPFGQDWGRGPRDPVTGLYSRYVYPVGHPNHPDAPPSASWERVAGQWTAVLYDFQRLLGVNLEATFNTATWSWFDRMLGGVLSEPTSLLRRRLFEEGKAA